MFYLNLDRRILISDTKIHPGLLNVREGRPYLNSRKDVYYQSIRLLRLVSIVKKIITTNSNLRVNSNRSPSVRPDQYMLVYLHDT